MTATTLRASAGRPRARLPRGVRRALLALWLGAICAFVLAPLVAIVGASLSDRPYWEFPPSTISLDAYERLFRDRDIVESLQVSFATASLSGLFGTALGGLVAFAIVRDRRGVNQPLAAVVLMPLMVPHIALGAALYAIYVQLGIPIRLGTLVLAQLVIVMPFCVRALMVSLQAMDAQVEKAAMNLGARPWQTIVWVTLPGLRAGIAVSFVLGFTTSFDDAAIALFINSPSTVNMPIRLLSYLEEEVGPFIAAGGTVLLLTGLAVVLLISRLVGFSRAFGIERRD